MESRQSKKLTRREFFKLARLAGASLGLSACAPTFAPTSTPASTVSRIGADKPDASDLIHLVCYPEIEDFDLLARLGINTVLV